jgi:chloramphenicol-sensitive protein RarD
MLFDLLLLMAGPLTAIPLLFFTGAARRLPLTTIGFLQYVSPTLQFLMAALLFGEPFTRAHGVAFACIWVALALVALHAARRARSL